RDAAEVVDDLRERGGDDSLDERRQQQRHHQPRVDREHAADRVLVARGRVCETRGDAHSTGCGAGTSPRWERLSRIATPIVAPPTSCSGAIVSERRITPKTAARKNCRFAKRDAREGP